MPESTIDLSGVSRAVKPSPEGALLWDALPELYRAGLQKGFSLGLEFSTAFDAEAERRRLDGFSKEEVRQAQELRLTEIFQAILS
jgi:hypothetical protein